MKVINIHERTVEQPVAEVAKLFATLASDNDMILATDKWPRMYLDKGLQIGSKGGHGIIRYFVTQYQPNKSITFQFDLKGFDGYHRFELRALEANRTQLFHIIDMKTTGWATVQWALAIRWLHDAYMEDAFDKVENFFSENKKYPQWNWWVRLLRKALNTKNK